MSNCFLRGRPSCACPSSRSSSFRTSDASGPQRGELVGQPLVLLSKAVVRRGFGGSPPARPAGRSGRHRWKRRRRTLVLVLRGLHKLLGGIGRRLLDPGRRRRPRRRPNLLARQLLRILLPRLLLGAGAADASLLVNDNTALRWSEAMTLRGGVLDGAAKFDDGRRLAPTAAGGGCSNGVEPPFPTAQFGRTSSPAAA